MLSRLAVETGGRLTRATNDLSLGYARAQRDLGCRYTIGIYVESGDEGVTHRMTLKVLKPGLRVHHPGQYMFRPESVREEARVMAAFMAPEMFRTDYVRAYPFTLQPRTPGSWDLLIAVNFPVTFGDIDDPDDRSFKTEFGAIVHQRSKIYHEFNRSITVRSPSESAIKERRFTFLEPVILEPGRYTLTVVVAEAGSRPGPGATRIEFEIPDVPRKELMLVAPILGRPRAENIVVRGDGPETDRRRHGSAELAAYDVVGQRGSFEPMIVQRAGELETLLTRNKACLVGTRRQAPETTIGRSLAREEEPGLDLPPIPLELEKDGKVMCQDLFEIIDDAMIDPGHYLFEAVIEESRKMPAVQQVLRFAVEEASP
jgi:hypothetical protein